MSEKVRQEWMLPRRETRCCELKSSSPLALICSLDTGLGSFAWSRLPHVLPLARPLSGGMEQGAGGAELWGAQGGGIRAPGALFFQTEFSLTRWQKIPESNSSSFTGSPGRVMIITDAINIYGKEIPSRLPLLLMFFIITVSLPIIKLPYWLTFHRMYSLPNGCGVL